MSLFPFAKLRKKKSASIAKDRLQIIVTHSRRSASAQDRPDYLDMMRDELIKVIAKYVNIDKEQVNVILGSEKLELNVMLPEGGTLQTLLHTGKGEQASH